MTRAKWFAALLSGLCCCAQFSWAAEAFEPLSYSAALKKAAAEKKWVFIDFYTTWCGPCKMMEATTFQDPEVIRWLHEKTVPIKVDAEAELELAAKFNVEFYPTLLLLKSDGTEYERLLGGQPPERFKQTLKQLETGKTSLQQAKERFDAAPNDPALRMALANELSQRSRNDEAWAHYLNCYQTGVTADPKFELLRDSVLLDLMLQMGNAYEPARTFFTAQRDAAEARINEGKVDRADCLLVSRVNTATGDDQRSLDLYEKVAGSGNAPDTRTMLEALMPVLVRQKKYDEIAHSMDVADAANQLIDRARQTIAYVGKHWNGDDAEAFRTGTSEETAIRLSDYYQVLLASGKTQEAAELAHKVFDLSRTVMVYDAMSWSGFLSGHPVKDNIEQAQIALEMHGGDSVPTLDTLVRLMDALGRTDEAIKLCEKALETVSDAYNRAMIQQALSDIRGK